MRQYDTPEHVGTLLGNYFLEEELGSGGSSVVYSARSTKDRDAVAAVKVLNLNGGSVLIQRFRNECRIGRKIASSPHVGLLAVYESGELPLPYLVTELLKGELLSQLVARGKLDERRVVHIALQL